MAVREQEMSSNNHHHGLVDWEYTLHLPPPNEFRRYSQPGEISEKAWVLQTASRSTRLTAVYSELDKDRQHLSTRRYKNKANQFNKRSENADEM